ncbi:MAG TPA: inorganic phosphate transporter [Thermoguttaceae bacterium]|nr:inorganic phosphate transporter [Thermoguttaceae bacterium]
MEMFIPVAALLGLAMLLWDCVEVGRNDAANIVNAVFGSRILRRRTAVFVAGVAVVLGATFATPVMETARKGIFEPGQLTLKMALAVYVSVYLVDTVLLYSYSAFGMPVSTTACLVFELMGASLGMYGLSMVHGGTVGADIVHWEKVGTVVSAIFVSILMSGIGGFLIQRVFRGAIRDQYQDRETILLHGPWIAGLMLTWLAYFMLLKGLQGVGFVQHLREATVDVYGASAALLAMWACFTLAVHLLLTLSGPRGTRHLFHVTALLGMLCMAFAFGQNDLANCASPGLSAIWLWRHADESVAIATRVDIPIWALFGCGLLIVLGMSTRHAQRVTRAEVNTGSQFDHVALYAPKWCQAVARGLLRLRPKGEALAPPPALSEQGKKIHYDAMRASVIMSVSASVIALASSRGLPVSTTYVAFAAVVATGLADRVMARGDADLKIGRAIWVITSWFLAALVAMGAAAVVARTVYHLEIAGLVIVLALNLAVRYFAKRRSDAQEERIHGRLAAANAEGIYEGEAAEQGGIA